ncbi:hypothetical protein B0H16DRAFT_1712584 [Mycena metata]|uniref:Uncharacterized protein n=1 Tax=Mycena metata TaxID=1033252 RepID=A0AAD7NU51_9AGAR|nr:hypothetical protein B0H16DRAFT_1712584 [Mycena metata]
MSLEPQIQISKAHLQLGERYVNLDYILANKIQDGLVLFYDNAFTLWPVKELTPQQGDDDDHVPELIDIGDDTLGMGLLRRKVRAKL